MIIEKWKAIDKGALKAFFDLKVPKWGDFVIRNMKLFQKDGKRWVAFPAEKVEADGEVKYFPVCKFPDKKTHDSFGEEVMKAISQYAQKQEELQKKVNDNAEPANVPF